MRLVFSIISILTSLTFYAQDSNGIVSTSEEFIKKSSKIVSLLYDALDIIPDFEYEEVLQNKTIKNANKLFISEAKVIYLNSKDSTIIDSVVPVITYLQNLSNKKNDYEIDSVELLNVNTEKLKMHPSILSAYELNYSYYDIWVTSSNQNKLTRYIEYINQTNIYEGFENMKFYTIIKKYNSRRETIYPEVFIHAITLKKSL